MNYSLVSKTGASLLLIGVLAACGGGGDAGPVAAVPAPTTFNVAGTAAAGAAFGGATITVIDSKNITYPKAGGPAVTTDPVTGVYSITLPLTATPPFVVLATRDDQTLVSVVAQAVSTTTNITPVTNLIASRLSPSGDPSKLASEIQLGTATVNTTTLAAKVTEIVNLIQPLMTAVGSTSDPLNGTLVVGTGADKVLDSLSISITPSSATSVNISVSVKQQLADNAQPAVIAFTNTTAPATALATVTATDLVPSGTTPLIADLLQRMTACYALALTDRVASGGTAAADIIAPACKDIFVGKDPTSYKHNGGIVSSKQAFSSIFASGGTGVKFHRGTYEFTRSNGDLVIAYRATDASGNSTNGTLVLRTDTDGKLRAIGNQYKYNGSVVAWHQLRTFINQPAATYYSTGYLPNVNNSVDASGNSIFAKVVVTTPKGGTLTLQPTAGSSYLPLVKGTTVTGTNFLRIRSVYVDAANSAKNPADADTSLFFASTPLTDADIAALANQSVWQFDYYLASSPTTIDATQYYKTRARAMTIAELQTQPLATLTDADIANFKATTKTNSAGGLYVPTPATGPLTLDWVVPTGALAPTSIEVWGGATVSGIKISFNDQTSVASTARTGNITCSAATSNDKHCDAAGNYVPGGFGDAHLWASDRYGREFSSHYSYYTITIP
jgi:hypothetical protein